MPHHRSPANYNDDKVTAVNVERALKGAQYPASRDELIACAERNQADTDVVGRIGMLPGDHYETEADVMTAFSRSQSQGKNKSMK